MLSHLHISNYALIEEASIQFNEQMVTITGESGAGKSIVINALAIVLGGRANHSAIRVGADKCVVEVTFKKVSETCQAYLKSNDFDVFDELILRREITSNGRSRAFVNDTPTSLSEIKEIAEFVIDIYGQHEYIALSKPNFQVSQLDSFAGINDLIHRYKGVYQDWRETSAQLEQLLESEAQVRKDTDYNQFQYDELEAANLDGVSLSDLESELGLLENAEEIISALNHVDHAITDESGVTDILNQALSKLRKLSESNSKVNEISERLNSVYQEVEDISSDIVRLAGEVEVNPQKTEEIQDRINAINGLLHKHSVDSIQELTTLKEAYAAKLSHNLNFDEELSEVKSELEALENEARALAEVIDNNRNSAKGSFAQEVKAVLSELGMSKSEFLVDVKKSNQLTVNGMSTVEFLFDANNTGVLNSISMVASGGEIARLMLALKVVGNENGQCLIFDEIDSGVSGEIAKRIGSVMRELSKQSQCIAITHLPGVASQGHQHLKIYKTDLEGKTKTKVDALSEEARVVELAAMFSGNQPTESAIETARILRAQAH